ncbi:MAG: dephospho-CoA kinase [Lachnospiraceae bacterium]|uniref:Dephospho-CoA kinase n=1 Tax=Hominiventricola filiformis TaxID=2885352 RepID=A0AAE3DA95_9FIRM|nr:dephospho-CoA kinase [Hominiventricola filiformis]MCC2125542.1 dephospho-CoA kinase [Hominiventricola filiformis]MCI6879375.1 dephospho-CoA kinase [Clostridiaceae bacterium]MDY3826085.1 dephospho-CoA kinase [Lachnospiraceae bacterium]RHU86021.1 dephospho-CoA kinase [Clostridiaceae bacterium OM08-6BH]
MKIIGVTGGVGAGKSTVLNYLEKRYGAKLILADLVGHEVMEPGHEAYEQVVKVFGQEIVSEDKTIDRKALGAIVFADEKKRMILNRIIHPAVRQEILRRLEEAELLHLSYVVVEAALFLEENYDAFCDETWYIYTDEKIRRQRLKESRGYSDERIDQIFRSQKTHEEFQKRCLFMIDNNGSEEETFRQIDRRMKE